MTHTRPPRARPLTIALATVSDRYVAFDPLAAPFIDNPRDVQVIVDRDSGQAGLDLWVEEHGGQIEDYNFYTFATRYVYRYIGFEKETGENLGFLEVQPR